MITVYTRQDLIKEEELNLIDEIKPYDFRFSIEPMNKAELVVFFDDYGVYRILKNRYTDDDPRTKELLELIGIKVINTFDENLKKETTLPVFVSPGVCIVEKD